MSRQKREITPLIKLNDTKPKPIFLKKLFTKKCVHYVVKVRKIN